MSAPRHLSQENSFGSTLSAARSAVSAIGGQVMGFSLHTLLRAI